MAFPKYFFEFPDTKYAFSVNKAGKPNFINIKDYFHYMKLIDIQFAESIFYYNYQVQDGERPEQVSYKNYGDEQYYWIVLQVNKIVDVYSEWPLSQRDLQKHVLKKYGSWAKASEIKLYETPEIKNEDGITLLKKGLIVGSDFSFRYPLGNGSFGFAQPIPITNNEWEKRENEKKSEIVLLKRDLLSRYVREYRKFARGLEESNSQINISDYFI